MTRWPADPTPTGIDGWHGQFFSDQASFCDGSARIISGMRYPNWTLFQMTEMNYADPNGGLDWNWFLRKNTTWTSDAYPTPGVFIVMRRPDGTVVTPSINNIPATARTRWPFLNYTQVD
jgi:hypothetical protein